MLNVFIYTKYEYRWSPMIMESANYNTKSVPLNKCYDIPNNSMKSPYSLLLLDFKECQLKKTSYLTSIMSSVSPQLQSYRTWSCTTSDFIAIFNLRVECARSHKSENASLIYSQNHFHRSVTTISIRFASCPRNNYYTMSSQRYEN